MMHLVCEDHVDCVFALNYGRSQGAQQALNELGLRIGEDISFACYDYLDTKTYFHPSITTVCPPSLEIGTNAAREILSMIQEGRLAGVAPRIPTRTSPGCPPSSAWTHSALVIGARAHNAMAPQPTWVAGPSRFCKMSVGR